MPLTAKLSIETERREERTTVKTAFCTQPFKLANITGDRRQHPLRLMLMSSSPGVLDGDCYDMNIVVGEGCQVELETQSFQRLFQMKGGASQTLAVKMAKGSSFCYVPHPVVPHQDSRFKSTSRLYLAEECRLLWGEVLCCGRKLNGEVFQFTSYHSLTEIYLKEKLVVKENLLLKPTEKSLAGMGQWEGYTHQATLLYIDEKAPVQNLIETLVNRLNNESAITFGVSALPVPGIVVRLLGNKAEPLFLLLKTIAALIQEDQHHRVEKIKTYVA